MKYYIGIIIAAVGLLLLGVSSLVLFGTFIYDLIKTDLSFFSIILDALMNVTITGLSGLILLITGLVIRDWGWNSLHIK